MGPVDRRAFVIGDRVEIFDPRTRPGLTGILRPKIRICRSCGWDSPGKARLGHRIERVFPVPAILIGVRAALVEADIDARTTLLQRVKDAPQDKIDACE